MFDHCLYFNTTALARLLEKEWTQAFAPFELTPSQAFMLRVVLEKPGLLQRELADTLTIARPTATRTLDGLQAKGLIRREATERDGREYALFPTDAALALKAPITAASQAVTRKLKKVLSTEKFEATVDHIHSVRAVLQ